LGIIEIVSIFLDVLGIGWLVTACYFVDALIDVGSVSIPIFPFIQRHQVLNPISISIIGSSYLIEARISVGDLISIAVVKIIARQRGL